MEEKGGEVRDKNGGRAIASMILGLVGLVAWVVPLLGLPISIVGLIFGINGRKSGRRGMATAGVVLSIIALVLTAANLAFGAYLGITGKYTL